MINLIEYIKKITGSGSIMIIVPIGFILIFLYIGLYC